MGSISSGIGLVSGINSGQIIDQLIALDSRPITTLQRRIEGNNAVKVAFTDLQARLSSLLNSANTLVRPSTFQGAVGTSSDTNTLGVTVSPTAANGQYSFRVARTVTSQSAVSRGFDASTALVGAGVIKVGLGGGEVTSSANLSDLNGGAGVRRGQFRVTDRSGATASIDISTALNLDDVVKRINTATGIQVKASVSKDGLELTDTSGGSGTLKVDELSGGNAAADLGILGTAGVANTLTGTVINKLGNASLTASLNDGLGVRTKTGGDIAVSVADGSVVNVSLAGKKTIGEVIDAFNTAGGGKFTVALRADKRGLAVTDNTVGGGQLSFAALNGSKAVEDVGLAGVAGVDDVVGNAITSNLGSVLLKNLKGGSGTGTPGSLALRDRAGALASVDLSAATSLDDVVGAINSAGTGLRAAINRSGTGLSITDTSSGSGQILIGDDTGTLATTLGIAGTYAAGTTSIESGVLNRRYVSENSPLSELNGGKGIAPGKFRITNRSGVQTEIDTSTLASPKLGDVINAINSANAGVTASINSAGSGLLLTDSSGGGGTLRVEDINGATATDLKLTNAAVGNTIDGAYGAAITLTSADTLDSAITKINAAGVGVAASLINDGSGATPFRLSLSAQNSGQLGRFTFDAGTTSLGVDTLTRASNAAVFLGTGASAVLLSSSSNTLANVLPGVSLNLVSANDNPVTVSVTQNADTAIASLKSFVTTFNGLTSKLKDLTSFDTATNKRGLLLGDSTARAVNQQLFSALNSTVSGSGRFSIFAQIGITVAADNQIVFDESKFRSAYSADPVSTQRVFTAFNSVKTTKTTTSGGATVSETSTTTPFGSDPAGVNVGTDGSGNTVTTTVKTEGFGLGYQLQAAINKLIDPVNGSIIQSNKTLDQANEVFNTRILSLNTTIAAKRSRLQKQFANMESVLSQLQSQQSALGRIQNVQQTQR
jgi:flagellar hook-associated protein 2